MEPSGVAGTGGHQCGRVPTGKPYFLEPTPSPYLGVRSSFNHVAQSRGMEYEELVGTVLDSAMGRQACIMPDTARC